MLHRLLYPWNLPPYGLPNTQAFTWNPKNLSDELVQLPDHVRSIVEAIKDEWMFDFSCTVARQIRRIGARLDEHHAPVGAVLIANEQQRVSPVTSAHAFLMSLAQPAAFEIAGLMTADPAPALPSTCSEITGVAFFAETASKRGSGRRLRETLQQLALETTRRCSSEDFLSPDVQFSHSKPSQARSPIEGFGTIPVAGYRITFAGCSPENVLQALADAIQALPSAHRVCDRSDVMVLSNLWTPAAV